MNACMKKGFINNSYYAVYTLCMHVWKKNLLTTVAVPDIFNSLFHIDKYQLENTENSIK